jgi:hypothetical protein
MCDNKAKPVATTGAALGYAMATARTNGARLQGRRHDTGARSQG